MANAGSPTYPVSTISKLLLLTDRRVQQLVKDGVIPKTEHGRYELAPAVQGYIRYLQDRTVGNAAAPADYHLEKSRLTRLQADKAEMEVMELSGELVKVEDVVSEWESQLMDMKGKLLSIPSKLATLISEIDNPAEAQDLMDTYIRESLQELSDYAGDRRHQAEPIESKSGTKTSSEADD
jgi:phage terminase Nu1 subunit (DNA packaging protein)